MRSTAFALGKLGVRVRVLGMLGRDVSGESALATLAPGGVVSSQVARSSLGTAMSAVLVDSSGERALLHRPGASRQCSSGPSAGTIRSLACFLPAIGEDLLLTPNQNPHAFDIDDGPRISILFPGWFLEWVSSAQRYGVTSA